MKTDIIKLRLLNIDRSSNVSIVNMQNKSCDCKEDFNYQIMCNHLCAVFCNLNYINKILEINLVFILYFKLKINTLDISK